MAHRNDNNSPEDGLRAYAVRTGATLWLSLGATALLLGVAPTTLREHVKRMGAKEEDLPLEWVTQGLRRHAEAEAATGDTSQLAALRHYAEAEGIGFEVIDLTRGAL